MAFNVKGKNVHIAIVSTNKDKYSETFIHRHVQCLPAQVHFLFDGYLPTQVSSDKGMTAHSILGLRKERNLWPFYKYAITERERLALAIEHYLKNHRIEVLLCEYGPSGVELMSIAKKCKIPLVVHFHGYDAYRKDVLSTYGKHYPELFSVAAKVIAVSNHMALQLQSLGCDKHKVRYLCYGVDTQLFQAKGKKKQNPVFVACGRFVKKKAPQLTLEAFALVLKKHPEAKLRMIGDGELWQECKDLTAILGIQEAVEFKGVLTQADIALEFNTALAFLQHSITTDDNDSEGTPLTILEAMSAGLPVVSTKHGGIAEVVTEGETGFLVHEGDVQAMADRMNFLMANTQIAQQMGEKGSERAHKNYHLKQYTDTLFQILKECIR